MGGYWAAELKYAGYDHVVLRGKAEKPVYIAIDNDDVRIMDASEIWGKDTYVAPQMIRKELRDPEAKVVCIGEAGEKQVVYGSLLSNIGNAAGRNGMGAVLGSKHVKGIAVRGTKGVRVADPEGFFAYCRKLHELVKKAPGFEETSKRGSMKSQYLSGTSGYAPAGNQQVFDWEGKAEFLDWWEKFGVKRTGCGVCPMQCAETYTIPGIGSGVVSCMAYTEPTWGIKNDDVMLWWELVRNCQIYGIDVISISGIMAWVMELYEEGVISKEETDGLEMRWGNREAILKMMKKVIQREGVGDALAGGFPEAIKVFGEKSKGYAMQVKNSPCYIASPRFPFMGLNAALGPRGDINRSFVPFPRGMIRLHGDPNTSKEEKEEMMREYEDQAEKITGTKRAAKIMGFEGKPKALIYGETMFLVADLMGVCRRMGPENLQVFNPENQAELYSIGLGRKVSSGDLLKAAERSRNVERAFEVREGLTRQDDTIPEREFNKEAGGKFKGIYIDREEFERAKDEYYTLRGWDVETGAPTRETLTALGLNDISKDLEKRKIMA
jgi:aldehyde:ferredoxin oxidoreductase